MKNFQGLTSERLNELLLKMKELKVVLLGDMCIDIYWFADMTKSQLSRETPHFPLPVTHEKMSPGAGGNVAVNLSVLCDNVRPVGVIGDDWRGKCLKDVLSKLNIPSDYIVEAENRVTNAYCKPMRRGYSGVDVEDPRIDFEAGEAISTELEEKLIEKLEEACRDADVLCVSDQFEFGCVSDMVREKVSEIAGRGLLTFVDSRSRISLYRNCVLKPNEIECARAVGMDDASLSSAEADDAKLEGAIRALSEKANASVCMTLGDRGCMVLYGGSLARINAVKLSDPIDVCGAGDCFISAFSLALAAGADAKEAGIIGTLASAICVKKINMTGSASCEELLSLFMSEGE